MKRYHIVNLQELHEKKVRDILDDKQMWNLPMVEKDADIETVLSILTSRDHVWVVEKRGGKKLCGIITESDILRLISPTRLPKYVFGKKYSISLQYGTARRASDIMHKQLITCSPDETIGNVLMRMVNARVRRCPVVENDEIMGEITVHYILQILLGKR
ncbi:MAG: CBS domain-containing protein [Thermoplasmata archaeon]|nr:CBS domain-containing protein [Thermoplasmata archaeon]